MRIVGEHVHEIQSKLQKVPKYVSNVASLKGANLFYPADSIKLRYVKSIVSKILSLGRIQSAYDFGCGTGLYVEEFIRQGVDTLGFEGNLGAAREAKTDLTNIVFANLEYSVSNSLEPRDLIFSIELVEHLSSKGGEVFCKDITRLSKEWIVITASPDEGEFHLNPQPKEFWIRTVESQGKHIYRESTTKEFMEYFKKLILPEDGLVWFKRDLIIFEKK